MAKKSLKTQMAELLIFVCLILAGFKLSGSIIASDWSWWVVFSPLSVLAVNYMIIGGLLTYKYYYSFVNYKNRQKDIRS